MALNSIKFIQRRFLMIYVGIDVAKDKHDCFITESVSSFVETKKTDIRYVISYFGQSQFFEVLPLLVL